ncbi:MAG: hypothetical protein R3F61_29410 [Myxococcota bacterium]
MSVVWDLDSADGCVAVARGDGTFELWEGADRVCVRHLGSPLRFVRLRVADGALELLAGDEAGRLWRGSAPRDEPAQLGLEAIQLDNDAVMCGDWYQERVYVGAESGSVIEIGEHGLRILAPFGASVLSLRADGERLWFGTADGWVRGLDPQLRLQIEFRVAGSLSMIWGLAPSPRGLAIAAGGCAVVWDDGREQARVTSPDRTELCTAVRWVELGSTKPATGDLVLACGPHVLVHDGTSAVVATSTHHDASIRALTVDGNAVYTGCEAGELARWRIGGTPEVLVDPGELPEEPDPTDDVDLTGLWMHESELTDERDLLAADGPTEEVPPAPLRPPPGPAPVEPPVPARPVEPPVPEPVVAQAAGPARFRDGVPAAPPPPPPTRKG